MRGVWFALALSVPLWALILGAGYLAWRWW